MAGGRIDPLLQGRRIQRRLPLDGEGLDRAIWLYESVGFTPVAEKSVEEWGKQLEIRSIEFVRRVTNR